MKRYPWKRLNEWLPWWWSFPVNRGRVIPSHIGPIFWLPRVPPDTARRRLRRRQMETLAALVLTAKRMGKEVR